MCPVISHAMIQAFSRQERARRVRTRTRALNRACRVHVTSTTPALAQRHAPFALTHNTRWAKAARQLLTVVTG